MKETNQGMGPQRSLEQMSIGQLKELRRRSRKKPLRARAPELGPQVRGTQVPLSFAQERLWFLDQLGLVGPAYNMALALRLEGQLNLSALERTFAELIRRHESLRTRFEAVQGTPVQVIDPPGPLVLAIRDLSDLPQQQQQAQIQRLGGLEVEHPFDLAVGPLFRVSLVRLGHAEHVLLLTIHHIVADGWSTGVLNRELTALYTAYSQGNDSPLAELSIQYADYAIWQREWLQGEVLETQLRYWRERLAGAPPHLELPTDRTRPAQASFRGGLVSFELPADLCDELRKLSQAQGATLFMIMLAAYQVLLFRYSGQEDLVVGSPIAARGQVQTEGLIGFFVNTLILRADLAGNPGFRHLLARVRQTTLDAYAHQEVPFAKVVAELRPERHLSRQPIFQVSLVLQNFPQEALELAGLRWTPIDIEQVTALFDLKLQLTETPSGMSGVFEYSTDLFDLETIERMAAHLRVLLEAIVADPDCPIEQLELLARADRDRVLRQFNDTSAPYPHRPVHELFEEQATRTPHTLAAFYGGQSLTYAELDRRATQLARYLIDLGVGPDRLVGLCVERGLEMLAGVLGILKAGGAFLPLDPAYPLERLKYLLTDAAPDVLLTLRNLRGRLPQTSAHVLALDGDWQLRAAHEGNLESRRPAVRCNHTAYVIYTSGSTGHPKGVVVEHGNVVSLWRSLEPVYESRACERIAMNASLSFDASVKQLVQLLSGRAVFVVPQSVREDPAALVRFVAEHQLHSIDCTPSQLRSWLAAGLLQGGDCPLRVVLVGGESIDMELWRILSQHAGVHFYNVYGPTESTVDVTIGYVRADASRPHVGRPLANRRVYLLDRHRQLVPIGVSGEIYAAGAGVAREYLRRPQLTAERFLNDPFHDESPGRMYRTGDFGRWRADGNLEFLGRTDDQVKIRGYRIELGEIEAMLATHECLQGAVVIAHGQDGGDRRLIAYVCPKRAYLEQKARLQNQESVGQWTAVFEDQYTHVADDVKVDLNFSGWISSYNDEPIALEQMQEWLEGTLRSLADLKPRRVLEIGCGSGLLLYRYASGCEAVLATDISAAALSSLRQELDRRGWQHVRLAQGDALDFTACAGAVFDTVVINSVVQYFPNLEYLEEMLVRVLPHIEAGGRILLGDIRNLDLFAAHAAAIERSRLGGQDIAVGVLASRVQRRLQQEKELLVSPSYFVRLPQRYSQIARVDILVKRGVGDNEMLHYRYEVVLHKKGEAGGPVEASQPLRWFDFKDLQELRQRLTGEPFAISGVPNARVREDQVLAEGLRHWPASQRVSPQEEPGRLSQHSQEQVQALECVLREAEALGYRCGVTWSQQRLDELDILFSREELAPVQARSPYRQAEQANYPQIGSIGDELSGQLEEYLRQRLPEYMVPGVHIPLERFPLTPNNKIDKRALPDPEEGDLRRQPYAPPGNEVEERLCQLWQELLKVRRVGIHDNFFALGGHSLLATRLISAIRQSLQVSIPLRSVFEHPTPEQLARVITLYSVRERRRSYESEGGGVAAMLEGEV
ncbi:MAG TPA: amino acid adenylation domain-containing protein [Steroidobacteraceae bacterium]